MEIQLRDYQKAASDKAVAFLTDPKIKQKYSVFLWHSGNLRYLCGVLAKYKHNIMCDRGFLYPLST